MKFIDKYLYFFVALLVLVLYIIRDQGLIVLSAETVLQLGILAAVARGLVEVRRRAKLETQIASPEPLPSEIQTPPNGTADASLDGPSDRKDSG